MTLCSTCGCKCVPAGHPSQGLTYCFTEEIFEVRVSDAKEVERCCNESIRRVLSGECLLHGGRDYVSGYKYITYNEDEMKTSDYIRGFIEGHIRHFELK